MQFTALSTVEHRIRVGEPLPFDVHDADRTLLLARGQRVESAEQLRALLERGALVDLAQLQTEQERLRRLPRDQLVRRWQLCLDSAEQALRRVPYESFRIALDTVTTPVVALIERDPDLAIFQILRGEGGERTAYGVRRSLNCAITAYLVARRLGWDAPAMQRVFRVALTMNVSMLELQGELARQRTPPTPAQLAALQSHPLRSARMLELSGVRDADWLLAVARHHEVEHGGGYPAGIGEVGDLASLARRADVYTAKLASRSHRSALAADVAGRQMFMDDPGHPMTAALVKEFGIYPPGCCVRLVSGAVGIVVERGALVTTPVVACLSGPGGASLPAPVRVDTALPQHAVAGVIGEHRMNLDVTADKLLSLALR